MHKICKLQSKVCTKNGILRGEEGLKTKSLHKHKGETVHIFWNNSIKDMS